MNEFIKRLQSLISEKKTTVTDVAAATGLDRSSLTQLLNGKRKKMPQRKTIIKLAEFFACDPDWLKTGEGLPRGRQNERCTAGMSEDFDMRVNDVLAALKMWWRTKPGDNTATSFIVEIIRRFPEWRPQGNQQAEDIEIIKNPDERRSRLAGAER